MENNERDRKLEQWLDEALSEYSAAEPRFGLEQRVLNRVRGEEKARSRWNLWKWMPAFAAIAAAVVVAVAVRPMLTTKPEVKISPESSKAAVQEPRKIESADNGGQASVPPKHAEVKLRSTQQPLDKRVVGTTQFQINTQAAKDRDEAAFAIGGPVQKSKMIATNQVIQPAPPPPPPLPQYGYSVNGAANMPAGSAGGAATPTVQVSAEQLPINGRNDALIVTNGRQIAPAAPVLLPSVADSKTETAVVPSGIVATEPVKVAKEPPTLKRMKKLQREQAAAAAAQADEANVMTVMGGVRLRTDLKQVPNGPMQFPAPSPLSEQEKLVMAAAKKMKDVPKTGEQGGTIPAVEIKDVQIAPIEAPKK